MMDELIFDPYAYDQDVAQQDLQRGEYANNVTFNAPAPAAAVGSWSDWFKPAGVFVAGVANTASQILSTRDALIAKNEESAFNRVLKTAQLDLAKYQITSGSALEKSKLDAALATQLSATRAAGTGQTTLFGIPIASGGGSSNLLLLAGLAVAGYLVMKKAH